RTAASRPWPRRRAPAGCRAPRLPCNAAGIPFSGYSGLVADLTGTPRDRAFLLLEAQGLRVAHVTLHEGVLDAVRRITPALIEQAVEALRTTHLHRRSGRPGADPVSLRPRAQRPGCGRPGRLGTAVFLPPWQLRKL